ncbi:hypothetical protein K402DRAFT_57868 [Aulographum hederae CBS 113979]|uniref:Uncharacterized protein n=1 Tax=Aulographum hederae CBS 113979 TaxID=1176131 RepID=A0A6G1H2X9_9PEZI|nr:hypothetical protein K402DRAFT_57868 [Aulographum hederae CBS 113979]
MAPNRANKRARKNTSRAPATAKNAARGRMKATASIPRSVVRLRTRKPTSAASQTPEETMKNRRMASRLRRVTHAFSIDHLTSAQRQHHRVRFEGLTEDELKILKDAWNDMGPLQHRKVYAMLFKRRRALLDKLIEALDEELDLDVLPEKMPLNLSAENNELLYWFIVDTDFEGSLAGDTIEEYDE